MANGTDKVYYNRGYLFRKKDDPVGVSGENDSLELYVYGVNDKVTTTGQQILELQCSGNFNKNNGIDYVLGEDVYSDKDKGLVFITCSAWDMKRERLQKLNVRKGFVLLVYGKFEKQTYTRQDGSQGVSVVCKNVKNFFITKYPNDGQGGNTAPAQSNSAPAPAPAAQAPTQNTPAPAPAPAAPVALPMNEPQAPVGNTAPVDASDVQVPF